MKKRIHSEFISEDKNIFKFSVNSFLPLSVTIPFAEREGLPQTLLVKEGEFVKEGQALISNSNGKIHASVPGTVTKIQEFTFPGGFSGGSVSIKLEGAFSYTGKKINEASWRENDAKTLLFYLCEKGLVNTFSGREDDIKTQISKFSSRGKFIVLRLFDSDPSHVVESFLAQNKQKEIFEGIQIIAHAAGAHGILLASDSSFAEPEIFNSALPVAVLPLQADSYPSGLKNNIIAAAANSKLKDPFNKLSTDDLFLDCQTALDAYNAVVLGIPVTERYVHVTGDCLNAAAIMKIKVGTPIKTLVDQCGGVKRPISKIIINGRAGGISTDSLETPVSRQVKSLEFIPKKDFPKVETENCIRCGECHSVCPVGLYPESLYRAFIHTRDFDNDNLSEKTAIICSLCGLCNSVCPSRIPLAQIIEKLQERQF